MGRPRQITRTYTSDRRMHGPGKRMTEKKVAALVTAVENGEHGEVGRRKATLGNLLDEWLAYSERMGCSPKTL